MDPYRVIRGPHNSEKGNEYIEEKNTYTFRVDSDATKTDIRQAVETLFNVKVKSVRTINVSGKRKRYGRHVGFTSSWKKAMVRLAEGQAIEALR